MTGWVDQHIHGGTAQKPGTGGADGPGDDAARPMYLVDPVTSGRGGMARPRAA